MATFDPLMSDPFANVAAGNVPKTVMQGKDVLSSYERGLQAAGFGPGGFEKAGDYIWQPNQSKMSTGATSGGNTWGGGGRGGTVSIPNWGSVNSGGVRANWATLQRNAKRVGNTAWTAGRGFQKLKAASQVAQLNSMNKQMATLQAQQKASITDPDTMIGFADSWAKQPATAPTPSNPTPSFSSTLPKRQRVSRVVKPPTF